MEAANADAIARGFSGGKCGARSRRPDRSPRRLEPLVAGRRPRGRLRRPACARGRELLDSRPASGSRVLGPNGGGKTTLFRVLLGELQPLRGTVRLARRCGTVPQTERSRLDYPVTALDVALMGTLGRRAVVAAAGARRAKRALEALALVGLEELARRRFGELSGGQRQRVLDRPRRWSRTRGCCCSTSRSPASTRRAPTGWMALIDRLAARGPRPDDRHARRRAGARAGTSCSASTGARSRSGRPRRSLDRRSAGGDVRRRDRDARRRRRTGRAILPPHHSRLTRHDGGLGCADRPVERADHAARARSRSTLLGVVGGALGCWIVFYGLSYSAESLATRCFPGWCSRR